MSESMTSHMHEDIEEMKRNISLIINILSEEGELTEEAKKRLADARKAPDSEYVRFE